jgi:hypothetical protein
MSVWTHGCDSCNADQPVEYVAPNYLCERCRRVLVRVVAPHFVAGILFDAQGVCREAAPVLHWAIGKTARELRRYFDRKGWLAERLGVAAA